MSSFGIDATALIGEGAEAQVFALDERTVLRVGRSGSIEGDLVARSELLKRLKQPNGFQVPIVKDSGLRAGFFFSIEERLSGAPMSEVLKQVNGSQRESLILDYLRVSTQLSKLIEKQDFFGEIGLEDAITESDFGIFLLNRAKASLRVGKLNIDVCGIVDNIPRPEQSDLVHLDYCPSNVLCENGKITAVLDFGGTTIAGCAKFNPVVAATFLDPTITPTARGSDQAFADRWLLNWGEPAAQDYIKAWLAAYWSFCGRNEELALFKWCQKTLAKFEP